MIPGVIGEEAPSDGDRVLLAIPGMAELERRVGKEVDSVPGIDMGDDPDGLGEPIACICAIRC
jgi:hypothetical protein